MLRPLIMLVFLAGLTLPARAQVAGPPTFIGPDGAKNFGTVTWVWKSRHFHPLKGPFRLKDGMYASERGV